MNYESSVRYLLSLGRELAVPTQAAAAKFDLENITILAERLGHPERAYPSVHIAGTNGKGSTAAFLESILRQAGFRTGLNTSPSRKNQRTHSHQWRRNQRHRFRRYPLSHSSLDRRTPRLRQTSWASHLFRMCNGHGFRVFRPRARCIRRV